MLRTLLPAVLLVVSGIGFHAAGDDGEKPKPPPKLNPNKAPGPAPQDMVWISGGEFFMGSEEKRFIRVERFVA